jgi:cAMP phosphodiesterase
MKIRVLGCAGAEFPGHNISAFLLDEKLLFDAGSLTNVLGPKELLKIKHIFITHAHLDHVKGIPFLADNILVGNRRHRVDVLGLSSVIKTIKRDLLNSAVWPDFTVIPDSRNGILSLKEIKAGQPLKIGKYTITPYPVTHSVPAAGYLVEEKKRRFFYTGDIGPSDTTWKKLGERKIDSLIIDVSFPNKKKEIALRTGHLTPLLLKKELSKISPSPEKIYVTHLKPQYFKTIRNELQRLKIENLSLLRDGETIEV